MSTTSTTTTELSTCPQCGTPLASDGLVDESRIAPARSEQDQHRARLEDRADVENRLQRARAGLKSARKHGDELAGVTASRRIEQYEERLSHIDELLADSAIIEPPTNGPCPECGTTFRGGQLDVAAATELRRVHRERGAHLRALNEELEGARNLLATLQLESERAEERAKSGRNASEERRTVIELRERAEHTTARLPEIEREIARVRAEMERETPAARGVTRAFVNGPKGLRKRAEAR